MRTPAARPGVGQEPPTLLRPTIHAPLAWERSAPQFTPPSTDGKILYALQWAARAFRNELPGILPVGAGVIADEGRLRLHFPPVMAVICRKLVLLLALAVMPLQGVAAPLSARACQSERPEHAAQAMVVDDLHDDGMRHDTQPRDEGGASGQAGHFCCHNVACGLPAVARQAALPEFAVRHSVSHPLNDLFFPDRPQRPPLA